MMFKLNTDKYLHIYPSWISHSPIGISDSLRVSRLGSALRLSWRCRSTSTSTPTQCSTRPCWSWRPTPRPGMVWYCIVWYGIVWYGMVKPCWSWRPTPRPSMQLGSCEYFWKTSCLNLLKYFNRNCWHTFHATGGGKQCGKGCFSSLFRWKPVYKNLD